MSSENNSVNSIVKRIYIAADVELASPLSITVQRKIRIRMY